MLKASCFFSLILAATVILACKPRQDTTTTKSIGAESGSDIIIFQADDTNVYRRVCTTPAAAMSAGQCPGPKKTIPDFKTTLANQGTNAADIDTIIKLLSDWRTHDTDEPKIKNLISFDDLNRAFGINSQGGQTWVGGAAPTVVVPPPSSTDSPLAKDEVLAAMKQIRSKFNMDLNQYVIPCLANDTPHWSDIVIHYYCILGQPRACFTPKARAYSKDLDGYQKAYAECKDETQNHASNNFDWIVSNQADVFRYVMYSVYTPGRAKTFRQEDQDAVINEFYGVTDPENISDCNKRPRRKNETRPAGEHCGKRVVVNPPPQPPVQPVPPTPPVQPAPPTVKPTPPSVQPAPPAVQSSVSACNRYSGIDTTSNRIACKNDKARCDWDYNKKICFTLAGPDCEYYSTLGSDDTQIRMACKNHSMGCNWAYGVKKCFRLKAGYCSYYNNLGGDTDVRLACKSNGCTWDYNANQCR